MHTATLLFLGIALGGDPSAVPARSFTEQVIRSPAIPDCGAAKLREYSYEKTLEAI
jgi:hypothetical protein